MIHKLSTGDGAELKWFKGGYSDSGSPNDCVEVATSSSAAAVRVRDSKMTEGHQLAFIRAAWAGFLTSVR